MCQHAFFAFINFFSADAVQRLSVSQQYPPSVSFAALRSRAFVRLPAFQAGSYCKTEQTGLNRQCAQVQGHGRGREAIGNQESSFGRWEEVRLAETHSTVQHRMGESDKPCLTITKLTQCFPPFFFLNDSYLL